MTRPWCLVVLVSVVLGGPLPAGAVSGGQASPTQAADLETAVRAYREHLARNPGDAKVRSNLGAALAALGRYGEAIEAYKEALALAPADLVIRLNLALAYYKSADIPRAAEELDTLHREQPGDLRTTLLLADCRLRLGEYETVAGLLRPVESADPENQAVLYMLGMALIRSGKPEEGQQRVERHHAGRRHGGGPLPARRGLIHGRGVPPGSPGFLEGPRPRPPPPVASLVLRAGAALHRRSGGRGARPSRGPGRRLGNDYEANYYLASILAVRKRPAEARPLAERASSFDPVRRTPGSCLHRPRADGRDPAAGRVAALRESGAGRWSCG